ncbi:unnamed protein product, partial [Meganyctiphanes norvegica]
VEDGVKNCIDGEESFESPCLTDILDWIDEVYSKGPSCENSQMPDKCYGICHPCLPPRILLGGSCGVLEALNIPRCKPGYVNDYTQNHRCVRAYGFSTVFV